MNQRGFLSPAIYVTGGLILALTIVGALLHQSVQANGELRATNTQLEQAVIDANKAVQAAEAERRRVEVITLDNMVVRENVDVVREVVRDKIVEVERNVEPENCLVQPIDDRIIRMFRDPDGDSTGAGEDVSAGTPGPGLPEARVYRADLWGSGSVRF